MDSFKGRTKLTMILGTRKLMFSGNKKGAQIIPLADGLEARVHKLATGFRFKADNYRTVELTFDQIAERNYTVTLSLKS